MTSSAAAPLWSVRGSSFFLFGSIHVGPPAGFPSPARLWQVLSTAQVLYVEVEHQRAAFAPRLVERTAGSLRDDLGESLYRRFTSSEIYDPSFETIRPGLIPIRIAGAEVARMGLAYEHGIDLQVQERAAELSVPVRGLETAMDQLGPILDLAAPVVARGIESLLANPGLMRESIELVISSYIAGDDHGLARARSMVHERAPEVAPLLFRERENRWLPVIERLIESDTPTLVIVGANHLVGSDGLVERLRSNGYEIRRG